MADYLKEDLYTSEEIDPKKIFNPAQQVRKSNANVNIEDIEKTLPLYGLSKPLVVCESEISKNQDEYDYHLVDGQRRLTACLNMKMKKIPVRVYRKGKTIKEPEIEALATVLNLTSLAMKRKDIWEQIKKQYFLNNNDARKTSDITGIPYMTIKEAVAENKITEVKGGVELRDYIIQKGLLKTDTVKITDRILDICLKADNSVDLSKAKKLHDAIVKEDYPVQKNILSTAEFNPDGEIKTWVQDGKNQVITKNVSVKMAETDINLIKQYIEDNDLGVDIKTFIYDTIMDEVK
tara:strand:- start:232 stop:1107 length:876 start_codon:yes stop_codon:yes gene_type:complete